MDVKQFQHDGAGVYPDPHDFRVGTDAVLKRLGGGKAQDFADLDVDAQQLAGFAKPVVEALQHQIQRLQHLKAQVIQALVLKVWCQLIQHLGLPVEEVGDDLLGRPAVRLQHGVDDLFEIQFDDFQQGLLGMDIFGRQRFAPSMQHVLAFIVEGLEAVVGHGVGSRVRARSACRSILPLGSIG
ncbi:MAG: hypothetical protein HZT40_20530 [Candidatus Thiothrix singaporensis]|uniref:Uncharacterized protein n=1 Tax=Candidatus Thiothrix singaporensis TaxID=2799669 RepID=A0A7L6AX64_9GAMM|nr:MAG: hypothetical protein HZT40_20530 [Candidatus Thiothrix singaporensis]